MALAHDVGVTWNSCDQPNCTFRSKEPVPLRIHKSHVHGIGKTMIFKACPKCSYKAKTAQCLGKHVLQKHTPRSEGLWYLCLSPGCTAKSRMRPNLLAHCRKAKHPLPPAPRQLLVPQSARRGLSVPTAVGRPSGIPLPTLPPPALPPS